MYCQLKMVFAVLAAYVICGHIHAEQNVNIKTKLLLESVSLAHVDVFNSFVPQEYIGDSDHGLGNFTTAGVQAGNEQVSVAVKGSFFTDSCELSLDEASFSLAGNHFLMKIGKQEFLWGLGKLLQPAFFLKKIPVSNQEYRSVYNVRTGWGLNVMLPIDNHTLNCYGAFDGLWEDPTPQEQWFFFLVQDSLSFGSLFTYFDAGFFRFDDSNFLQFAAESELDLGEGWIVRASFNAEIPFDDKGISEFQPSALVGIDNAHSSGWYVNFEGGYQDGFQIGFLAGTAPVDMIWRLSTLHLYTIDEMNYNGQAELQMTFGFLSHIVRFSGFADFKDDVQNPKAKLTASYMLKITY